MNAHTPERLLRWMSVSIQPEYISLDHKAQDDIAWAADKIAEMKAALELIADWRLPETGKFWDGSGNPMSYGACYGSNGERDYMRDIAENALKDVVI